MQNDLPINVMRRNEDAIKTAAGNLKTNIKQTQGHSFAQSILSHRDLLLLL